MGEKVKTSPCPIDAGIMRFNRILRTELVFLGVDFVDMRTWDSIERISEASIDYAISFHEDVMRG